MSTETAAGIAITAVAVGVLGVEPQVVAWSLVGSILGLTLAKPASRVYAVALFVAATLACALLATVIADHYFDGRLGPRNVCAVILAAAFHPLFDAFIASVPSIVAAGVKRFRAVLGGSPKL